MKRISIAGMFLTVVIALCGFAASSASALPKGLCWKVEFEKTGNYNQGCLKDEGLLKGTYVLAELIEKQGVNLYCAKIDLNEKTGSSEGPRCEQLLGTTGEETSVLFGLPTLLLLTGGTLPLTALVVDKTTKTKLETKLGELTGEGILDQILWTNLNSGSLGPAVLLFTGVSEKTTKCNTTGDGTGLVLINNVEWHLVYILLDPLQVGILYLVPSFKITCGSVKETVEGNSATTISPIEEWVAATGLFKAVSSCLSNLKPDITKYWNDEGEEKTIKLEAEINGLGKKEEACENVEGEIPVEPKEMLEISQP
jgi:hypothetical protein